MCATACPVDIDTGQLTKRLRRDRRSAIAQELACVAAARLSGLERLARAVLRLDRWWRSRRPGRRASLSRGEWPGAAHWPVASPGRPEQAAAVYFPSCVSRTVGDEDSSPLRPLLDVAARAGLPLHIPGDAEGRCCGMPFSSKGFDRAHRLAVNACIAWLWRASEAGRLPVVVDSSPCAYSLRHSAHDLTAGNRARLARMRVLDGIEFAHDHVLPALALRPRYLRVVLHPPCSAIKLQLDGKLLRVAQAAAAHAEIPIAAGCCGFAGDRGLWLPELTRAATRAEALEVRAGSFDGFFGSSRTCEIGLSWATGSPYRSFWHLLDAASRVVSSPGDSACAPASRSPGAGARGTAAQAAGAAPAP
jgi:D-lactate dehydrogenase